jgi:hypothetical protein
VATLDEVFDVPMVDFALSIGSDHTGLQVQYQHILDSVIDLNPHLTLYLINDKSKDCSICHLSEHSCYVPYGLTSAALINQEADQLSQEIEDTCQAIFKKCSQFSLRAAVWWDEQCNKAAVEVREALTLDTHKQTHKALIKEVQAAKCRWANDFLQDATPKHLWTAAKWWLGPRQRLIPALTTPLGLTDDPPKMADTLCDRFFKSQPHPIPETFPDDPPVARPRPFAPITTAKIADVLRLTSNKSTPGLSRHNYKLVKWAFAAQQD